MDKNIVTCAVNWMAYNRYKPDTDRYVIIAQINNSGQLNQLEYRYYSEIPYRILNNNTDNIYWIDIPTK